MYCFVGICNYKRNLITESQIHYGMETYDRIVIVCLVGTHGPCGRSRVMESLHSDTQYT